MTLRKILLIFLITLTLPIYAAELPFFDDTFGDFQEELQNAKDQGKDGILLFFEMDECPFCHRMKTTILNQPKVEAYFRKHFLNFTVDIEGDLEITDFAGHQTTQKDFAFKQHRVRATPVIAFFDLNGKRVVRYTGATSSLEEFMMLGKFVVEKKYLTESFTRYKRAQRNAN